MKNKTIILIISILITCTLLVLLLIGNNSILTKSYGFKDNKDIAIFIYDYETEDYRTVGNIPVGDFELEERSFCKNGSKILSYNSAQGVVKYKLDNADKCYLYFKERLTLSQAVILKENPNELISSQDGSPYIIKHETAVGPTIDATYTKVNNFGTTQMYSATSRTAVSGTDATGKLTMAADGTWSNVPSNMSNNTSYHVVLPIVEEGYYEICYTFGPGNTANNIFAYITDSANSTSGYEVLFINALANATKNGCQYIGHLANTEAVRVVNTAYTNIASVSFYLQKTNDESDPIDAGIRYEGKDPDNYVTFNNEEWRIIGSFEGSTIGLEPGKQYTKIIKNTSIGWKEWDAGQIEENWDYIYDQGEPENDWTNSTLNAYLNGEYLESLIDSNKIAQYNGNYSTWYLRGANNNQSKNAVSSDWYLIERVTGSAGSKNGVHGAADVTTQSAIALMYPSDYGYAAYGEGCTRKKSLVTYGVIEDYDTMEASGCGVVDWLMVYDDWLLSPDTDTDVLSNAFVVYASEGGVVAEALDVLAGYYAVRPVLYLESDVYITDGDGSQANPYKLERPKTLSNAVIGQVSDNEYTSSQDQTKYVVRHEEVEHEGTTYDAGVRYEGKNPNNYIEFNGGEEWRIIGTFEGSTIGLEPGKQYTKIIKNTPMSKAWDEFQEDEEGNLLYENDWTNSTLNVYLNGEYLQGLTDKTKIAKYNGNYSTWHLRGMAYYQNSISTTNDWYLAERVTGGAGYRNGVLGDADETTKSAIALMYPSDYGYAAYGEGCTRVTTILGSYGTIEDYDTMEVLGCAGVDWLLLENDYEWLLSPLLDLSDSAFGVNGIGGYVGTDSVDYENEVRPVLYLEYNVEIKSGTGTKADPYILK